jgi:hypothetical protein
MKLGAGTTSAPQKSATPENNEWKDIPAGAPARSVTPEQRDNPKPKYVGGVAVHPVTGGVLAKNKWHSSWVGVSGYTEPKPLTEAASNVQQFGKTKVIPKQKGASYIPTSVRGARPEIPHRETDYEGNAVPLTAQQRQENKVASDSQANWDAHDAVEKEHGKAHGVSQQIEAQQYRQESPKSSQLNGLGDDYAVVDADMLGTRGNLSEHHADLLHIHSTLAPLVHLGGHVRQVAAQMAQDTAGQAANIARSLNERKPDGTPKVAEGSERRELLLDGLNKADQRSDDLNSFGTRHLKVMNSVAEAKRHLDMAGKALASSRDDDASRLLGAAAGHLRAVTKHLAAPISRGVFAAANHPLPADLANGLHKSTVEDILQQVRDRPSASSGVRNPNPEPLRFNYKGMIHTYPLNKDGLAKAKKHFGTLHDNYRKLQDAISANRSDRAPLSDLGRDVGKELAFTQRYEDGRPVGKPGETLIDVRKPTAPQAPTAAAQRRRPIPDKPSTTHPPTLQTHTKIAVKHIMDGLAIPDDTQRILGKQGLNELAQWAKDTHGKDVIT